MPINSVHPDYAARRQQWTRCRDAFDGQDAIKSKGKLYLPMLSRQKLPDYKAYKDRALFFSITGKTVSALVGMAMLRTPIIEMPTEMESYFKDDQGIQFYEILSSALAENLLMGRFGILVDRPASGGDPKICKYYTENIINWEVNELGAPNWVVLEECVTRDGNDRYQKTYESQYRLLELINGVYAQSTYDARGNQVGPTVYPTNLGVTMDFIPFYIVNPFGLGFGVEKPPMLEIVDINISHYRSSADLEHGRHFTALPTPVVSGATSQNELTIGGTSAWILPDPHAKAVFLEFTGQGLQSLEKALVEKQGQLASMSARLLDNSKRGSEAADTVRLRYASETANLAMIARATEALMSKVYATVAIMKDLDPKQIRIQLNKEFLDSRISAKEVVDFVDSYLNGGITEETLVFNLRRGDILDVTRDDDDEIVALRTMKKAREAALAASKAPKPSSSIN